MHSKENTKSVSQGVTIQLSHVKKGQIERSCVGAPGYAELFLKLTACLGTEMSQFRSGLISRDFLWAQRPADKEERFRRRLLSCSRLVGIKGSSAGDEDGVQVKPTAPSPGGSEGTGSS